jgi:hypothetical protein
MRAIYVDIVCTYFIAKNDISSGIVNAYPQVDCLELHMGEIESHQGLPRVVDLKIVYISTVC